MSEEPASPPQPKDPAKARQDRRVKIGFILVAAVVVAAIYWNQYRIVKNPPLLENWGGDLPRALSEANAGNHSVLALFVREPLSEDDRWFVTGPLGKKATLISERGFIRVRISLPPGLDSNVARDYRVQGTPTLVVLAPGGRELGRRAGRTELGESPLANFLSDPNGK